MSDLQCPWFALQTETGREPRALEQLELRGFEVFLPTHTVVRGWRSERRREVEAALFPGYLFSRFDYELRFEALNAPGVMRFVTCGTDPALVADLEIQNLRVVIAAGGLEPCSLLKVGQWVTIAFGPYAGIRGQLQKIKNRLRFVVGIQMFGRGLSVEVESGMLAA